LIDAHPGWFARNMRKTTSARAKVLAAVSKRYNLRNFPVVIGWCRLETTYVVLVIRPRTGKVIVYDFTGQEAAHRAAGFDIVESTDQAPADTI
jgi:hypothetical protein